MSRVKSHLAQVRHVNLKSQPVPDSGFLFPAGCKAVIQDIQYAVDYRGQTETYWKICKMFDKILMERVLSFVIRFA